MVNVCNEKNENARLVTVELFELFGPSTEGDIKTFQNVMVEGNVPERELSVFCRILKAIRPKTIFEIGTFIGNTTLHAAANSEATIYTLDLPLDHSLRINPPADPSLDVYPKVAGERFMQSVYVSRINQLYGDSMHFNFNPWYGKIDLVFVDACHHYEYVRNDSEKAFQLASPAGYIMWHDYAEWAPDVMRAVNECALQYSIVHIRGTSLAVTKVSSRKND